MNASLFSSLFCTIIGSATAASITLSNADFETGATGNAQPITGWVEIDPPGGQSDANYLDFRSGSINSRALHLKAESGNSVGQDMTLSDAGAIDATTFGEYTIELDYGYRAEFASSGNNFGHGDVTVRVALWNTTTNTELAGSNLTIDDPGVQTPHQWQQTDHQIALNYDNTAQTAGDVIQLRITQVLPDLGNLSWQATSMFDNITVEGGTPTDLVVTSTDSFSSSGEVGGSFSPSFTTYTLTNTNGSTPVSWTAGGSEAWVTTTPTSGILAAGESVGVTVSINASAEALDAGSYNDAVVFSNLASGITATRSVSLEVNDLVVGPSKVALLYVHSHPDDDGIFGGGLLPYYTQVRDLPVAVVGMVTRNSNGSNPLTAAGGVSRIAELRRAMDVYAGQTPGSGTLSGDDYQTGNIIHFTSGLIDTGCCDPLPDDSWSDSGDGFGWGTSSGTAGLGNLDGISDGRLAAAWSIAKQIRLYQPEVVVTCHDLEGDYGHSNHTAAAIAVIDAYDLAADASTDIDGLAPWQAKKLYLRGDTNDNRSAISYNGFNSDGGIHSLFHDFFEETSIGGLTPREEAELGLDQHASQDGLLEVSTVFVDGDRFEGDHSEWWTLYRSEVGSDNIAANFTISGDFTGRTYSGWARGDFFDNITVFPDFDEDGLDDRWEDFYFGNGDGAVTSAERALQGPSNDASDNDGRDNLAEFITGTNPNVSDEVDFNVNESTNSVTFSLPTATGPGYESLSRRYELQFSSDLIDWSTVVAQGTADGSPQSYAIPASGDHRYYRLSIILE